MKGKVIFVMQVDSAVDVITNSSSELFVLDSSTRMMAIEAVSGAHPFYRNEYREVCGIDDLDKDDLHNYLYMAVCRRVSYSSFYSRQQVESMPMPGNCQIEDLFDLVDVPEDYYDRKFPKGYQMKEDLSGAVDKIDPDRKLWFLFSIGENPNFEMQEELEKIARRYHGG